MESFNVGHKFFRKKTVGRVKDPSLVLECLFHIIQGQTKPDHYTAA